MAATQPGAAPTTPKPLVTIPPKRELTAEEKVKAATFGVALPKPNIQPADLPEIEPPQGLVTTGHAAAALGMVKLLKSDLATAQADAQAAQTAQVEAENRANAAEAQAADYKQRFQVLCDELGIDTSTPA